MRTRFAHSAAALALLAFAAGCTSETTEVVVVVETDLSVPSELDTVRIRVSGPSGDVAYDMAQALTGAAAPRLPLTLGVVDRSTALSPLRVEVRGQLAGSDVVTRGVLTSFTHGEIRTLTIRLPRSCRGVTCAAGESCTETGCHTEAVDGSSLPRWTGSVTPGDGGTTDASMDGCTPSAETCNGRDDDCDGRVDNGFDVMTDPSNCGSCGNACTFDHAAPMCTAGACARGACISGFADCNGMPSDGCETSLSTPDHCGSCGTACTLLHASAMCTGSTCGIAACDTGYGNCDMRADSGCETDLRTDSANCGACGHMCRGAVCANGSCTNEVVNGITAGAQHTCIVRGAPDSPQTLCWGGNANGQLGDGTMGDSSIPVRLVATVPATTPFRLGAGSSHTCGADDADVWCWGNNANGQLGPNGRTGSSSAPVVVGVNGASSIAGGLSHTCAVHSLQVSCWGNNTDGQLGLGTFVSHTMPTMTLASESTAVSAGQSHTCALLSNGNVQCWGSDRFGEVGDGTRPGGSAATPVMVSGVAEATWLASGDSHNCVVLRDGTVKCWGHNDSGQLGDGSMLDRTSAVVAGVTSASQVALGRSHSCALRTDGTVMCWGAGSAGQLGTGTLASSATPVMVTGITSAYAIGAGGDHTCVAVFGSGIRCWGDNASGELGNATTTRSATPVVVTGLP